MDGGLQNDQSAPKVTPHFQIQVYCTSCPYLRSPKNFPGSVLGYNDHCKLRAIIMGHAEKSYIFFNDSEKKPHAHLQPRVCVSDYLGEVNIK